MYAIVTDGNSWWIQGDEGRVNEHLLIGRGEAKKFAKALVANGMDVDLSYYWIQANDEDGPDWDHAIPLG